MMHFYICCLLQRQESQQLTSSKFNADDGPCAQALHQALEDIGVQRQAYYSGTFVGNHVHKCLQVQCSKNILKNNTIRNHALFQDDNIPKICGSFTKVVSEPILHEAKELSSVFGNLFHLFAVCRQTYSIADRLTELQIDELGTVSVLTYQFHASTT